MDSSLPVAHGMFVRNGIVPHFELRVDADSPAGVAIGAYEIEHNVRWGVSDSKGKEMIMKELRREQQSQIKK